MKFLLFLLAVGLVDAAVSSPGSGGTTIASKNLGSGFNALGSLIGRFVDPTVPMIPNRAAAAASSSTTTPSQPASAPATPPAKTVVPPTGG